MFRHPLARASTLAAVAALALPVHAADMLVYANDFSGSAGAEWSNTSIAISNGERFLGTSANGFGSGTVTLSLASLPAHSAVTVSFDLYIIQSMDGNGPNGGGADVWRLDVNGGNVLTTTFANYTGGNTQSYSAATPNGLGFSNAPRSGQFEANHLGFGTGDFGDATYRFTFTVADSSSNLAIAFTSLQNQAPGDEGWGLDNVSVQVTPVPEPATAGLWAAGLLGMGAVAARRRRSTR